MNQPIKVEFESGVSVTGQAIVILEVIAPVGVPHMFGAFLLDSEGNPGQMWAMCERPTRLSDIAFGSGAQTVKHSYDLVAEHGRIHG